ncbi:acyltransferase family protein [Lactococcus petauri]|uniref:acyltransferase family protein n=1 Tax=Lactococcus petauri TaxID=1940789 RepID=UPI003854499F
MKERNFLIDNAKGILIFLVVLGHSLELIRNDTDIGKMVYIFIYQFHMPVFIYFSGYVSKNVEKGRKNAVKNFLVPFLVLNIVWSVFRLLSVFFVGNATLSGGLLYSLLTPAWTLWYVLALFIWKILLPDLSKIKKIMLWSLIMGIGAGLFTEFRDYLSLSRIIKFTPFFMLGFFSHGQTMIPKIKQVKLISLGIILFTLLYSLFFFYAGLPVELLWWDRSYIAAGITEPMMGLGLSIGSYIIGFLWIFVFQSLVSSKKSVLSKIGKNTLSVYFLHTYFIGLFFYLMTFVHQNELKLILALASSLLLTYVFSRDSINNWIIKIIHKINVVVFIE